MSDTQTPNTTIVSGRFQPGNKMAAGRQSRGQKLRAAILASISRDDVQAITRVLIDQAKAGDLGAAKLLLSYIGKPDEGPTLAVQVNNQGQTSNSEPGRATAIVERIRVRRAAEAEREAQGGGPQIASQEPGRVAAIFERVRAQLAAEQSAEGG